MKPAHTGLTGMTNGLYVSPTQFVSFAEPRHTAPKGLGDHIATRDRSPDFSALGMYLPNPDPVLKKLGRDVSVYTDLLSDAHVGGCVRRRKAAVQVMEWRVEKEGASTRMTKLAQTVLDGLNLRQVMDEALNAVLFGWAPMEIIWQHQNGANVPTEVVGKPQRWFHFDDQARLRFRSKQQPVYGEELDPRKFLLPRQGASYDNPYGRADLGQVFWPTTFKRGGLKFWVTFAEKFGTPWIVGKQPRGTGAAETDKLLDQLEAMVQDAVAVVPDDASVDITQAGGKSDAAGAYKELLLYCRSEIAIALLGQNQTTEATSNKASATAGLEVGKDLRDGDARVVESAINQLLRWMVDGNEGEAAPAPKFELFEQEEVNDVQAKRDEALSRAGASFTPAYWQRAYGFEAGDLKVQSEPGQPPAAATTTPDQPSATFAEPASVSPNPALAGPDPMATATQTLTKSTAPVWSGMVDQLQKLVDSATDMTDLQQAMLDAYGGLDSAELVKLMAAAMALAELKGMDDAKP